MGVIKYPNQPICGSENVSEKCHDNNDTLFLADESPL